MPRSSRQIWCSIRAFTSRSAILSCACRSTSQAEQDSEDFRNINGVIAKLLSRAVSAAITHQLPPARRQRGRVHVAGYEALYNIQFRTLKLTTPNYGGLNHLTDAKCGAVWKDESDEKSLQFLAPYMGLPWQSTSGTQSFSTMISPSKPWLTVRCLCYCNVHQAVKRTQEMCSISIHDFWSGQRS